MNGEVSSSAAVLVGILVVVHNRKEELDRLIRSVQNQDFRDFEILVIDDCSTDDISGVLNFPAVEYIRFEENIGFVAGMIMGIEYLLSKNKFRFLWVLDSDLEVAPTTLGHLVTVMQEQRDIGVAGCVIHNTYERDVVVEAGADVELRTGIVSARVCNERGPELDRIMDVGFIASGGGASLFCVEALKVTGKHDVRYYFLWEDTDYCLCLKQHGFRVVVVPDAVVYHPPFTEKRNPNIYAYYGVRNPLLTIAKHSSGFRMPYYLLINLSRYLRIGLLMLFDGRKLFARLTFRAVFDYLAGRFGKAELKQLERRKPLKEITELGNEIRIVILGLGSKNSVQAAVEFVRAAKCGEIILVVQNYRRELFSEVTVDRVITYDDRTPNLLREYWQTGMEILRQGGCIINTDLAIVSPLSYFAFRTFDWNHTKGVLFRSRSSLFTAWKPVAAILLGLFFALLLLPPVWLVSLRHKVKQSVFM